MNEHVFLPPPDPRPAAALLQAAILHHLLATGAGQPTLAELVRAMVGPGFGPSTIEYRAVDAAAAALVADGLAQWDDGRLAPSRAARRFDRLMFGETS